MFNLFWSLHILVLAMLMIEMVHSTTNSTTAKSSCPTIKLKRQWGGKLALAISYRPVPIKYVIIHHTVTPECETFLECAEILQGIQHYQMESLDIEDIGFNFLIGNDGIVYEGTGWYVRGAHTYGYNQNGTGIAFIGNFMAKLPSRKALAAAKQLLECGVENGALESNYELYAASQVSATKSPGLTLYNEIQEWDHWSPNPSD